MTTLFSTLGVITAILLIGVSLYYLYGKKKKLTFKLIRDGLGRKPSVTDDPGTQTFIPPLFTFCVESTGQVYDVKNIPTHGLTVGRDKPSDIIIRTKGDNCFSSEHMVICKDDKGYYVNVVQAAHAKNGIRLEPNISAPKINTSIDITHNLKLYIGFDTVTFYLPNAERGDNDIFDKSKADNRCARR